MTKNQENELFTTLAKLVTGVNVIQSDVRDIKGTLGEHSRVLATHTQRHDDHTLRFDRLESKVDSIAGKVMEHDRRLTVIEDDRVH